MIEYGIVSVHLDFYLPRNNINFQSDLSKSSEGEKKVHDLDVTPLKTDAWLNFINKFVLIEKDKKRLCVTS